jgi:ribA/ribD-fused uncharacterized protein
MRVDTEDKVLFWQDDSVFSNWFITDSFLMSGHLFTNSEAAFMWLKAEFFKDKVVANKILSNQNPAVVKKLGREIENFVSEEWDKVKVALMRKACYAKFKNSPHKEFLLATGTKQLVEASPFDKIWGIGFAPCDPNALDEKKWLGQNLLGIVLMDIRDEFQNECTQHQ